MLRQIFSVFFDSFAESYKLKELYRILVSRLGYLSIAIGCLAMIVLMYNSWLMFGLPLRGGSIEGLRLQLIAWIGLTVLLLPLVLYAAMVLVYGIFGLILLGLGKLTPRQAFDLAARTRYPRQWYPPDD